MRAALPLCLLLVACEREVAPVPPPTPAVVRIALPADPPVVLLPLVAGRCTACHSGEMIANQPALSADQWAATVKKMRDVYHAPLEPADDAAVVAALTGMRVARAP